MVKTILIRFAKANVDASKHVENVQEAITKANRNLYGRFGIWLSNLKVVNSGYIIQMSYPVEEQVEDLGRRLRGISQYLLKHYPSYKDYRNGTRLFSYYDIDTKEDQNDEVSKL